jgi:large subunit ribosomal protein L5
MHPYIEHYTTKTVPALKAQFTYSSVYLVPKVTKVVINIGIGDIMTNGGTVDSVAAMLTKIAGQKPVRTKARTSVSGFKIRQGMEVGMKVTLRGERMQDFLHKLINVALPRTRDFRGLNPGAVTKDGSMHIGIKDSMIFPEVAQENTSHPMQITLVAKTASKEEARAFYESLGFVFQAASN